VDAIPDIFIADMIYGIFSDVGARKKGRARAPNKRDATSTKFSSHVPSYGRGKRIEPLARKLGASAADVIDRGLNAELVAPFFPSSPSLSLLIPPAAPTSHWIFLIAEGARELRRFAIARNQGGINIHSREICIFT
jgi:hypothetical protein